MIKYRADSSAEEEKNGGGRRTFSRKKKGRIDFITYRKEVVLGGFGRVFSRGDLMAKNKSLKASRRESPQTGSTWKSSAKIQ